MYVPIEKAQHVTIVRVDNNGRNREEDSVIKEHALSITLSDEKFVRNRHYVTVFCSPFDLDILGLGFLLSDDIINTMDDVGSLSLSDDNSEIRVCVKNSAMLAEKLIAKRDVTSGCGRSLNSHENLDIKKLQLTSRNLRFSSETIIRFSSEFQAMSELYKSTGGVHAAALCDTNKIMIFKEDIGRHNAVDKVMGECLKKGFDFNDKLLLTSGRISSDMLLKAAKRGIPVVVSRSAPTSMALQFAENAGITLIGFARGRRMNIYSHDYRVE